MINFPERLNLSSVSRVMIKTAYCYFSIKFVFKLIVKTLINIYSKYLNVLTGSIEFDIHMSALFYSTVRRIRKDFENFIKSLGNSITHVLFELGRFRAKINQNLKFCDYEN